MNELITWHWWHWTGYWFEAQGHRGMGMEILWTR